MYLLFQDTTDDDSDFEEGYRKKSKPIMLKIKKEKVIIKPILLMYFDESGFKSYYFY